MPPAARGPLTAPASQSRHGEARAPAVPAGSCCCCKVLPCSTPYCVPASPASTGQPCQHRVPPCLHRVPPYLHFLLPLAPPRSPGHSRDTGAQPGREPVPAPRAAHPTDCCPTEAYPCLHRAALGLQCHLSCPGDGQQLPRRPHGPLWQAGEEIWRPALQTASPTSPACGHRRR